MSKPIIVYPADDSRNSFDMMLMEVVACVDTEHSFHAARLAQRLLQMYQHLEGVVDYGAKQAPKIQAQDNKKGAGEVCPPSRIPNS